jgi:hypothetical protein
MESISPYITITSVVFSLLFIVVEKKLDTQQVEIKAREGLLKNHIVLYFTIGFTLQFFAATKV